VDVVLQLAQDLGVLVLFTVTPWLDVPATRRLRANPTSAARLSLYRRICCAFWLGLAYVLAVAGPARIWTIARAPGEWSWLDNPYGAGAAIALCAAFFAAAFWPAVRVLRDPAQRVRFTRGMRSLAYFMPASAQERRWWAAVSVAAGVCEEFVMRGFLIQYFRGALDGSLHLGLTAAVLLSSVAFGIGHAYQGVSGIVRTGLIGGIFALTAVLSGSLLLPIVLHVLADLLTLLVYRPDDDAPGADPGAARAT